MQNPEISKATSVLSPSFSTAWETKHSFCKLTSLFLQGVKFQKQTPTLEFHQQFVPVHWRTNPSKTLVWPCCENRKCSRNNKHLVLWFSRCGVCQRLKILEVFPTLTILWFCDSIKCPAHHCRRMASFSPDFPRLDCCFPDPRVQQ